MAQHLLCVWFNWGKPIMMQNSVEAQAMFLLLLDMSIIQFWHHVTLPITRINLPELLVRWLT